MFTFVPNHFLMPKAYIYFLLFFISTQAIAQSSAKDATQTETKDFVYPKPVRKAKYNIAILTPLYLDSVDLEKNLTHIPKFMMPGIDFYEGVCIAADTLNSQGFKLNIYVYDSKSNYIDIKNLIASDKLDSMDVIIGNASVSDLKLVADFAKKKQINFISAVSPADAGQTYNPYFTILQPRLSSHIEKIHKNIISRYPEDNVVFITRNLTAEKNALSYFKNDLLNARPSRFTELELKGDELNINDIVSKIDTNYNTTIVLGILDPSITYNYLKTLSTVALRYHLKVYCMPTTEAIKSISKVDEFPGMPIYYTSSYIIDKVTPASQYITNAYKRKMGSLPSDVVYKGFESLYFFYNLLKKYGTPFNTHLSESAYSFITPYKIVPIKEKGSMKFYENKFLYLIKYEDGIMLYE